MLAHLPETPAGRQTSWLWSRMAAAAKGSALPDAAEIAEHFDAAVLTQIPSDILAAHFVRLASTIERVSEIVVEASFNHRYSALLRLPESWVRYRCVTADDAPHRIAEVSFSSALDPATYRDRQVRENGRTVQIRDFGEAGPLMFLWHGAGCDLSIWEALVPHLREFHLVAQDLPGHGRSALEVFTTEDFLADADAVAAGFGQVRPIILGHSLGGYLGLRYAAEGKCSGWIGLDGPFGLDYPWGLEDSGGSKTGLQIGREISAIDVAGTLAAANCPGLLFLCAAAGSEMEFPMIASRGRLAEHIARHHPAIQIEWVDAGHDTIVAHQPDRTASTIPVVFAEPTLIGLFQL